MPKLFFTLLQKNVFVLRGVVNFLNILLVKHINRVYLISPLKYKDEKIILYVHYF